MRDWSNCPRFKGWTDQTRIQGYALDDEEAVMGARCHRSPIFDATQSYWRSECKRPLTRITAKRSRSLPAMAKEAANSISRRLGYQKTVRSRRRKYNQIFFGGKIEERRLQKPRSP